MLRAVADTSARTPAGIAAADPIAANRKPRWVCRAAPPSNGPVVLVVPTVPHVDLPGGDVWWDVAPAEVSGQEWVQALRAKYEQARGPQKWFG